jgi:predicted transcriptional regulator
MGRPAAGSGIEMEQFIQVWIDAYKSGRNQSDVSRELGVTPAAVSTKAKKFRAMGIDLPELGRSSNSSGVNINAARDLMNKLLGEHVVEVKKQEAIFSDRGDQGASEDYI